MDKIHLLIDTHPGVDDALALLMAFDSGTHDIVGPAYTVRNALKLRKVAGRLTSTYPSWLN